MNLCFDYAGDPVLHRVQLTVKAGNLMHVCGKNGSGKTTLLKLIAGLLQPNDGEIRYAGQPITQNLYAYLQTICYVGHKTGMSHLLTIRENYDFELQREKLDTDLQYSKFSSDYTSRSQPIIFKEAVQSLVLVGLEDVMCGRLSAGQRRRVALMRLLLTNASLWLLDEPFAALDATGIAWLMECFTDHLSRGGQIIMTSHQPLPVSCLQSLEYHL